MKKAYGTQSLAAAGAILLLAGCASAPKTHLYILNTPHSLGNETRNLPRQDPLTVTIAPVDIPAYLDRPAVVTQVGENELAFSEFQRWAGPLKDNIQQILAANLAILLRSGQVFTEPRTYVVGGDYRVVIQIDTFCGVLGEKASLEARWSIYSSATKNTIATQTFKKDAVLSGSGEYKEYVLAQSGLLGDLSREIAAEIQKNYNP
jgi:uncharacterized lipoprotein YmbA